MSNSRPNPYIGPRAFEPGENLYGRERELRQLTAQLISERIVLLHSPSGAGKTSLIQAGLLPQMRAEKFNTLPVARVNLEPDVEMARLDGFNRYVYSVLAALEEGLPADQRRPLTSLAGLTLDDYLRERPRPADAPRSDLLIFDQFEEILTVQPTDRAGKQAFFTQLGMALRAQQRWVLFAIREDYLGALAPYVRPIPNRFETTFRLDLLGPEAAIEAIQQPARSAGLDFTDEAAHKLVDDLRSVQIQHLDGTLEATLGQHVEPVQLQVVCYRLWDGLAETVEAITLNDVAAVGSVDQSLAEYYAASVATTASATDIHERNIREWFDEKLITKEGVRGQALMGATTSDGLDNRAVRLLEDAHLVRAEKRAGATWYELAHDRLLEPIRRENLRWFEQNLSLLEKQAKLWDEQGRGEGLLLRGKALQQAEQQAKTLKLDADQAAFLEACRKLRSREQLNRRLVTGLVMLFAFAITALAFAGWAYNQSEARRVTALGRAALANGKPHQAAMIALQAQQIARVQEAQDLLFDATNDTSYLGGSLVGYSQANSVAWSADGRLASGSADGTVIVWNPSSNKPEQILKGHSKFVTSVAWSSDGRLASASVDNTVIIWNLQSGQPAQTLKGHSSDVTSVAWSTDGKLASGSWDHTIIIWDLQSGQPEKTLKEHFTGVSSVAWSADGRLASAGYDGTIMIWASHNHQLSQTLIADSYLVSVAWSADGRLAASTWDDTVIVWNLQSDQPEQTLRGHSSNVNSVAWSADGRLASASDDNTVIIWDLQSDQPAQTLKEYSSGVISVAWSADGRLASASYDGTLTLWDLHNYQPLQTLKGHSDNVTAVAWSTDGRLASASFDNTVILWDLLTNRPAQTLKGHSSYVASVAWSADGRLASGSWDDTIIIWDLHSGQPEQTLQGHVNIVNSVAWSADGKLASGSEDGTIIIWNLASGQPEQTLRRESDRVKSIAWSADGRLASGSEDGTVIIWDLQSGQPAQTLKRHSARAAAVAWSVDGKLASASYDHTVIVWDLHSGRPAQILHEHTFSANSVAWSADGRLASGSVDGTVIIWDLGSGKAAQTLKGNPIGMTSLAWLTDGKLAYGLENGSVQVIAEKLTHPVCEWVLRNLTVEEWKSTLGPLYPYQPACANLTSEKIPTFSEDFALYTWPGRLLMLAGVVVVSGLVFAFIALVFRVMRWSARRIQKALKK